MKRSDSKHEEHSANKRMTRVPISPDSEVEMDEDQVVEWVRATNPVTFSARFSTVLVANRFWRAIRVWFEQLHRVNAADLEKAINEWGLLDAVCQHAPLESGMIEFLLDCGADATARHDRNGSAGMLFVQRLLNENVIVPNEHMNQLIDRLETNCRRPHFMHIRDANRHPYYATLHTYFFAHIVFRGLRGGEVYSDQVWCDVLDQCRESSIFQAVYDVAFPGTESTRRLSLPYMLARFGRWQAFDRYIVKAKSFGPGVVRLRDLLYLKLNNVPYVDMVFRTLDFYRIETVLREIGSPEYNHDLLASFVRVVTDWPNLTTPRERHERVLASAGRVANCVALMTPALNYPLLQLFQQGAIYLHATYVPSLFCLLVTRMKLLVTDQNELNLCWRVQLFSNILLSIRRCRAFRNDRRMRMLDQIDLLIWCVANGLDPTVPLGPGSLSCAQSAVNLSIHMIITKLIEVYPDCYGQMINHAHITRNMVAWAVLSIQGLEAASDVEVDEEDARETDEIRQRIRNFVQTHPPTEVFLAYRNNSPDFMYHYLQVMRELRRNPGG